MSISKSLILLTMIATLAACANNNLPYPRATMFPGAEQQKIQSANHWDVLARHETTLILDSLGNGAESRPSLYLGNSVGTASPFESAYHNMLVSALVRNDVPVMLSRENAQFTLDFDVQVIEHKSREALPLRPGIVTAYFAAVAAGIDTQHWGDQGLILIPVVFAADLWNNFRKDTTAEVTEVIITTRVLDSQQITHSESRVYYFDPDDIAHYRNQGRTFSVVTTGAN